MKFLTLFVRMRARERIPCNRAAVHGAVCVLYIYIDVHKERDRKKEAQRKAGIVARYFLFGMSWMTTSSVKGYMTAAWCYDWLLPLPLPFECMHASCMHVRACLRAPKFQNYYAFFCFFNQKKCCLATKFFLFSASRHHFFCAQAAHKTDEHFTQIF